MVVAQSETIRVRVTLEQKVALERRAGEAGLGLSAFVRRELGVPAERFVVARREVLGDPVRRARVDAEKVRIRGEVAAVGLAERREARARELSATMPERNARMLAAREITE